MERKKNKTLPDNLGRIPPQAVDLEEAVLGALMIEKYGLSIVLDILTPDDFYLPKHQIIFSAIVELYKKDVPVDMRSMVAHLRKTGEIEKVGGAYYIAELTSRVATAANIEYHARILAEFSIKRSLIRISSSAIEMAYNDQTDCFETLDEVQRSFEAIGSKSIKGKYKSSSQLVKDSINTIYERMKKKGLTGVPSGFSTLDRVTAGFQNTDLIILAARPGMGKTAMVGEVAKNCAVNFKTPVGIFSLEMSSEQLIERMCCAEAEVESEGIRKGTVKEADFQRYGVAAEIIGGAPIFIDETAALSILEIRARARMMMSEKGVKMFIVDYLQLVQGEKSGNREQEISSIARGLKRMAKDLNVPVIALSQLSRGVEQRGGDKRPMLSDLRESGSIEQDADMVMFIYRAEYYKIMVDEEGRPTNGVMEIIIAKNRHGSLDTVPLKFIGKYMKVMDWDHVPQPVQPIHSIQRSSYKSPTPGEDNIPF